MDDKGLIQAQYQQPQPVVQGQAVIHQQQMVPGQMMAMMAASAPIALDATLVNVSLAWHSCLLAAPVTHPAPPVVRCPAVFRRYGGLPVLDVLLAVPVRPDPSARRPRPLRHRRVHGHAADHNPLGIMAAVIITPEIKMINCLTDADNHALIQAANEAGVCNPADPMHCSVALQLCPSMAEFNHALISTYAMTPVFMIAMCSVRPNPISLSLSLSLSRARALALSLSCSRALSHAST
jgi:hypothetical protein